MSPNNTWERKEVNQSVTWHFLTRFLSIKAIKTKGIGWGTISENISLGKEGSKISQKVTIIIEWPQITNCNLWNIRMGQIILNKYTSNKEDHWYKIAKCFLVFVLLIMSIIGTEQTWEKLNVVKMIIVVWF